MDENSMYTFNTNNDTIIVGTNEDDNIVNIADNVTIDTGDGDDNIISGLGNLLSTIDDSFAIGNENVSIASGNGNDSIMNIGDYVTINAGNDDDYVSIADVNSIGSAIILGGAGDDTINAGNTDNNSYVGGYPAYTTGHKNHTVDGGTGNDYISFMAPLDYSGPDSNMFIYREGDGDDTIYAVKMDYSYVQDSITGLIDTSTYTGETVIDFSTVIQIDSSSQPTSVNSGADLIIKVGDGSITFIGQAGQSLDIVDPSGGTINLVDDGTGATDTDTGSTDTDTNTETTNTDSTNPVSDGSLLKGDTDIVFLIDTSGSMGTYIERVRNALNSFADSLSSANVSYRLGLVDFGYDGNGSSNNYIKSYSFVEDVESFKNELANLPSYGAYEYGLAAIDTALNLDFREDAKKRFVMFTDEGYEENTSQSETILAELGDADVILDVVGRMGTSKGDCQYEWQPMANATGGNFYDISSLDGALNKIAENITTPVINVNLKDVPDGDAGVFLLYSTTDENGSTTFSSNATFISMGFTPYEYNGHYYGIYTNQSSWEDAETFCESWGGHLAIINDADENTALYDYMKSQGYDYAFFGLSDSDTEETWVWVNGEGVRKASQAAALKKITRCFMRTANGLTPDFLRAVLLSANGILAILKILKWLALSRTKKFTLPIVQRISGKILLFPTVGM